MKMIAVEKMYDLMQQVFIGSGVPAEEAKICADVLIASDLRGIESHGCGRLKMYYDRIKAGIQKAQTQIEVLQDKGAIAVWDGNHGMGQVIATRAMQKAIDKAREFGTGCVTVRNSTHYGIAGYYPLMAVQQEMIGISYTNARPSIAPLFGVMPMLGTNPIAFGAPSDLPYPFLYDAATSISQRGKIEVLARANKPTPAGWAIDRQGEICTDTQKLLVDLVSTDAAMVGLGGLEEETGGHKGYGLAVMVEILSAALQSGKYLNDVSGYRDGEQVPHCLGHYFQAIDIAAFTEVKDFKRITGDIMRQMQDSLKRPDKERIWVAGEKEYYIEQSVRENGIEINEALEKNIKTMISELGLKLEI